MRSLRLLPLVLVLAAAPACSEDDGGSDGRSGPGVGVVADGQDWELPYEDDDVTVCGDVAVWGPVGETPALVRADGSVTELEVDVPDDTAVELSDDPNARARCLRDDAGEPVVVVALQDRYDSLEDVPRTLFTGFDADGAQLWTWDGPVDASATYAGAGAFAVTERETDLWTFVDARTGQDLGSAEFQILDPVPLSTDVVAGSQELVGVTGEPLGEGGSAVPIDSSRALVEGSDGVRLLDLQTLEPVWTAPGFALELEAAAVDLSVGVVTMVGEDGALHGLDLATGEERWTSEAAVGRFGVGSVGQGVVVLPDDDFTSQVLVDSETGEELPSTDSYVIAGNDVLLVVGEDGTPAVAEVDDLR